MILNETKGLLSLIMLIFLISCTRDGQIVETNVPNVEVNLRININDPLYSRARNVGGWTYLNGGSRGIILYQQSFGVFVAYDRHCTFDPAEVCSTLDMNQAVPQAEDYDCCGSIFSVSNGSIIQGPATRPLVRYTTSYDGTFVTITN